MIIDKKLLDSLTEQARKNPRLRQAYDLRTQSTSSRQALPPDNSQRILNAVEPGTVLPIHRHRTTTETIVCLRGRCVQYLYDVRSTSSGTKKVEQVDAIYMAPCGTVSESFKFQKVQWVPGMSVEVGQWHRLESLESGTVILECKDGKYEPLSEEDVLEV